MASGNAGEIQNGGAAAQGSVQIRQGHSTRSAGREQGAVHGERAVRPAPQNTNQLQRLQGTLASPCACARTCIASHRFNCPRRANRRPARSALGLDVNIFIAARSTRMPASGRKRRRWTTTVTIAKTRPTMFMTRSCSSRSSSTKRPDRAAVALLWKEGASPHQPQLQTHTHSHTHKHL